MESRTILPHSIPSLLSTLAGVGVVVVVVGGNKNHKET